MYCAAINKPKALVAMKTIKKLLPLIVLLFFVLVVFVIKTTKPEARKRGQRPPPTLVVEVQEIQPQSYQVHLSSFGKITPTTQSQLSSQVSGQIVAVSENFKAGQFFSKGDVLVTLDDRDYNIRVQSASAERAQAQVALDEEKALSAQAIKDRKNLGTMSQASDYALRKPQMAAAQAKLQAADANLKQAQLDVERTRITAPYDGRLLTKKVSVGQVVSSSTALADIYAIDSAQVELPIKNSQLALINLPNNHLGEQRFNTSPITLLNNEGGVAQAWSAQIARTSGAIDENTQQISVIAEISQPFAKANKRSLNIGQFVTASIEGKIIDDALIIPNAAIYQGSYVYLHIDGLLERRNITISYQNNRESLVTEGINRGEKLVVTPLGQVNSGTPANILGQERMTPKKKRGDGKRRRTQETQL